MCQMCVKHITKALTDLEGVKACEVNLEANQATVTVEQPISEDIYQKVISQAGYELKGIV